MNATALRKENESLRLQLKEKDSIIAELKEKVVILEILHFGPKSEKWTGIDDRQALLFNEVEDETFR